MEKTVLMMRPEQRAKLTEIAPREHVSMSEINRRAIDAYDPDISDAELDQLADMLIQSCDQTVQALEEARKEVRETLDYFAEKRRNQNDI